MHKMTRRKFLAFLPIILITACSLGPQSAPAEVKEVPPTQAQSSGEIGSGPEISLPEATATPEVITPQNASLLKMILEITLPEPGNRLVWTADGLTLAVLSSNSLQRLDAATLANQGSVTLQQPYYLLDFSPDGITMATTADQAALELRSAVDGSLIRRITPTSGFTCAAFSPDGNTLVLNSIDDFSANLYDTRSGTFQKSLTGFQTAAPVYTLQYSSNGRYLIWIARAHVQLMGINSGTLGPSMMHEDFVMAAALNPDGSILATATDGLVSGNVVPYIKLWNASSGDPVAILQTPAIPPSLAFSPDGKLLAAAGWLWDVQRQAQVFELADPAGIQGAGFSPDGKTLAAINTEGKVTLWKVSP